MTDTHPACLSGRLRLPNEEAHSKTQHNYEALDKDELLPWIQVVTSRLVRGGHKTLST